jgi:hypothetical protein
MCKPLLSSSGRSRAYSRASLPIVLVTVLLTPQIAPAVEAGYSFRTPFHEEQCERAARFAERKRARSPTSSRGPLIAAEALLCEGLDDDPWALDAAIAALRQVAARRPGDFFAQLDFADALRKRFPCSAEALQALERARTLLARTDLGAAQAEMSAYIAENAAAVAQQRGRALALLEAHKLAVANQPVVASDTNEVAAALALTGLPGLQRAREMSDRYVAQHPDDSAATLLRAELSRGCVSPQESHALFVQVRQHLCPSRAAVQDNAQCAYLDWRVTQLLHLSERHARAGATGCVTQ